MKRHIYILTLVLICILVFVGCRCSHDWLDANCSSPATCTLCGVRQGEPLGHTWEAATCGATKICSTCGVTEGKPLDHAWVEADCETAKTCSACFATEGLPLGHVWTPASCEDAAACEVCGKINGEASGHSWTYATCTVPKTCSTCNQTEGKALGHKWLDATTEAPKTCSVCKATEGSAIKTDPRFKTSVCKPLFGTWKYSQTVTAEDMGLTDSDETFTAVTVLTFHHDGTMTVSTEIENEDDCRTMIEAGIIRDIYTSYASKGMSKEETNQYFLKFFGMTVQAYSADYASTYINTRLNNATQNVYYISDGVLHIAEHWEDEMQSANYSISGSALMLTDENSETTEFTRA